MCVFATTISDFCTDYKTGGKLVIASYLPELEPLTLESYGAVNHTSGVKLNVSADKPEIDPAVRSSQTWFAINAPLTVNCVLHALYKPPLSGTA